MKKLSLGLLAAVLTFSFVSCSIDEIESEIPQEPLLKSFKIKKDTEGYYSLDYDVADNTEAVTHKNINTLTNDIFLSKVGYNAKTQYSNDLRLENDKLQINFQDTETGKNPSVTIYDENITFAKGKSKTTRYLKSYGLTKNTDGTYQLDFKVKKDVTTDFVYNENLERYEVHLARGKAKNKTFTKIIDMPDTGRLRITFVNHFLLGKGLAERTTNKPDIIIVEED